MADPRIPVGELGEFRERIKEIMRRLAELEKPDGTQFGRAVEKILAIFETLDQQVADAIAANSYTKPVIDAKWSLQDAKSATQDAAINGKEPAFGVLGAGKGGTATANVYSTTSTGSQLQVYVRPDGMLTVGASSARFKRDITDADFDLTAFLALGARMFRWRDEVQSAEEEAYALQAFADDGGPPDPGPPEIVNAPFDYGLIAEEAEALGLDWLVRYGADGRADGVHYARVPIAQHAVLCEHDARIASLETQNQALLMLAQQQANQIADLASRVSKLEGAPS